MGLEAALERPGSALGTLVVVEDESEVVGRALPSDRLLERIRDRLLGHAPGHRPAHDLPAERVDHGCEVEPSLARSDVADQPYCGDRKALKDCNDPRTTHPKIAREWNRERNGDLKPTDVIASSNKRVWWKCEEGHEWSGLIANRTRRGKADPGCPYCSGRKVLAGYNDLATMTTFSPSTDVMAYRSSCVSRPCSAVGIDAEMRYAANVDGDMVSIKG